MSGIETVLRGNQDAVNEMLAAALALEDRWVVPMRPGKWSPSQIVEHVARALEESAHAVAGRRSKFPTFPGVLRPIARNLFFTRVLKKSAFPKARTTKAMNPASGPPTPADAGVRLQSAASQFEHECRKRFAQDPNMESSLFGVVSIEDYARFQELHTRHHCRQLSAPATG